MNRPSFTSLFAEELNSYLDYRESLKLTISDYTPSLKKLDAFMAIECRNKTFTKNNAKKWIQKLPTESPQGHYRRINASKLFFMFLFPQGYDLFLFDDVRNPPKTFTPHIYTKSEIQRYFEAVDTYDSSINLYHKIQLPVLFRILHSCGTRITETLMIRKQDVDLEAGIILLSETKNKKQRYIVLSESLQDHVKQFADKTFYRLHDTDYIFQNYKGKRIDKKIIYEVHRRILLKAGIPYKGKGEGPRIHDWRHTFAVNSFKQMDDNGIDMYVALPILSSYLGHATIMATERYLRMTMELFPEISEKMEKTFEKVFEGVAYAESN